MKIPYVKKIKNKLKTFEIKNFFQLTDGNSNALIDENGQLKAFGFVQGVYLGPPNEISSIQVVGDKKVFYTQSKQVYFSKSPAITHVKNLKVNSLASFVEIVHEGERKLLVVAQNGKAHLVENDGSTYTDFVVPRATFACVYNRMLFLAYKNKLYFSAVDNYTDFTNDLNRGGVVELDSRDGNIIEFAVNDGKLIIFTTKAIYEFIADGERVDYQLKKVLSHNINGIDKGSVRICCGKVVFLSDSKICVYDKGEITVINLNLNMDDYMLTNTIAVYKDTYFTIAVCYSSGFLMIGYDFKTNQQYSVTCPVPYICDGLYSIEPYGLIWEMVEDNSIISEFGFNSVKFDMATTDEKVLHKISLFSQTECKMSIQTDKETRVFGIKKGPNKLRVNIPALNFKMGFMGEEPLLIERIKIEYRLKES